MTKTKRHELILRLINENEIYGQQELQIALKNAGVDVTQATISRDINELNLIKSDGITKKFRYVKAYSTLSISSDHLSLIKTIIVNVCYSNNIIVVRTQPGGANTVCNIIDELKFNNVLGTIAGDDTIFMVVASKTDAEAVTQKIKEVIKNA